jgi:hypothetical protein
MTDFTLPPLVVDYGQLWVEVDLCGDGRAWARRAAADLLARQHWATFRTWAGKRQLTGLLEQAAALARKMPGASMGFLLIPSLKEGVKGLVCFSPIDLASHEGDNAWDTLLDELAPTLPGEDAPEITHIDTKAGECRRMRMRYAAGEGPERPVGEHNGYLWVFEEYGAAVIMSISFPSLLEAARWHPALDELATDVWLQQPEEMTEGNDHRR